MKKIQDIKNLLANSDADGAILAANEIIQAGSNDALLLAQAYYLRGNAHRQKGEWGEVMNSYLASMELHPDGPAAEAYRATQEIMQFYCKDYYNP